MFCATTLTSVLERYLRENPIKRSSAEQLRIAARLFERFAGPLPIGSVLYDVLRDWSNDLRTRCKHRTANNYVKSVYTLLRFACDEGLLASIPRTVRFPVAPPPIPRAYALSEIRLIIDVARALRGKGRRVNWRRRDFWEAAIRLGYETAARRGDLLNLRWDDVSIPDRIVTWQQGKTGQPQSARLSEETMTLLLTIRDGSGYLLPWPHGLTAFSKYFKRLVEKAGLGRGSLKWLRRTSATSVERQQRGAGRLQLGHKSQHVAEAHYIDPSQLPIDWPMPERL